MERNDCLTDAVCFKSLSCYYDDEKSGLKNNTVRLIDKEDSRFSMLGNWMRKKEYGYIKITRAELPNDSFMRQVRHITIFNDYMIITWRA